MILLLVLGLRMAVSEWEVDLDPAMCNNSFLEPNLHTRLSAYVVEKHDVLECDL